MIISRRRFGLRASMRALMPWTMLSASQKADAADTPKRSFNEWYYAHSILMPRDIGEKNQSHGVPGRANDWVVVFNLSAKDSTATITHYFDELPPKSRTLKIPARSSTVFTTQNLPEEEMPRKHIYGVRVQSSVPIIVQDTRSETENNVDPPALPGHSMNSCLAYPGPLGKRETIWAYPDGHVIRANATKENYEDREWLAVLNPNAGTAANIRITFNYRNAQLTHELTVPAERVREVNLYELKIIRDSGAFGVIVESQVPVIVQQIRRTVYKFRNVPDGMWSLVAYPVGDLDFPLPVAR